MGIPVKDQVSPVAHVAISTVLGITSTFGVQPQAGAKCIVYVGATHGSYGTITVTDNATPSNTYVQEVVASANASAPDVLIFRADSVVLPLAGNLAVTIKASTTGGVLVGFAETVLNVAPGLPLTLNSNSGTTNADPNSSSATLASPGAYFAAMGCDGSSGANNLATVAPWLQRGVEQDGATYDNFAGSDQLNAAGAQTCHWTWNTSGNIWNAAIVAYPADTLIGPAPAAVYPLSAN